MNCVKCLFNLNSLSKLIYNESRTISTTLTNYRDVVDRREMLRSVPTKDEGTVGEKTVDIDSTIRQ